MTTALSIIVLITSIVLIVSVGMMESVGSDYISLFSVYVV